MPSSSAATSRAARSRTRRSSWSARSRTRTSFVATASASRSGVAAGVAGDGRGGRRPVLPLDAFRRHADRDRRNAARSARRAVRGRHRRHGRDRAHPPPVRPARDQRPHRQRRLGRDALRGRGGSVLGAARGRRADVSEDARSTSSERSLRSRRATGRVRRSSSPRTCAPPSAREEAIAHFEAMRA